MIQTIQLSPGVTLRCFRDGRFKQGCLSVQLVRPMDGREAAMNALLGTVLLRGTRRYPSLRDITLALDDLYGASLSPLVRRVGDCQTTGLFCGFMDQRFALPGDRVLEPMADFLRQVLLEPDLEGGVFRERFVESEKRNLISAIECDRNDKQVYAMGKLLKLVCKNDSFGLSRLGEPEEVAAVTPRGLYDHYQKILRESPVNLLYVGSAQPERVAALLAPLFDLPGRSPLPLPVQRDLIPCPGAQVTQTMDVTQSKLCLGFTTPITNRTEQYPAMQLLNQVFGAGMTSKLFLNLREKQSLCYSIGSGYYGSKGIVTVSAGIDGASRDQAQAEILRQLELCAAGDITDRELQSAKEGVLSGLRAAHDSPGAIESYYSHAALNGLLMPPEACMEKIAAVELPQLARAARTLTLHSTYFLTERRAEP